MNDMKIIQQEDLDVLCSIWKQENIDVNFIKCYTINENEEGFVHTTTNPVYVYITKGSGYIQLHAIKHNLKKFQLVHIGNADKICVEALEAGLEYYYIEYKLVRNYTFDKTTSVTMHIKHPLLWNYKMTFENPLFLLKLLKRMEKYFLSSTPTESFGVKALFYQFLERIAQDSIRDCTCKENTDMVCQALKFMKQEHGRQIIIQDLLDDLGISSSHLNRLFKQMTGKSPKEYLSMLRLNSAKIRLLKTEDNLKDIAIACGYTDEYQFNRAFKKHIGIAPSGYRNLLGKNKYNIRQCIPLNPKRVAVQYLIGDVLALGVVPVGITEIYEGAVFQDKLSESIVLGHQSSWNKEILATLELDLIITIDPGKYQEFSEIAPTLYLPYEIISKEERILLLGTVLNRLEEAKMVLSEYHNKQSAAKNKLKKAGLYHATFSIIEGSAQNVSIMGNIFGCGATLYRELSLRASDLTQKSVLDLGYGVNRIDLESLQLNGGDYIIRNNYIGMEDMSANEIWNRIPAIKRNQVIEMDFGLNYYSDILSANAQIDYIVSQLTETGGITA
jgi:iron complex transport system substrate-binding protein